MAFADKWDFCDATSFWRILAAYCRALRAAAPGRFAVVQAWQMRLIRVHDEPKLDPNVGPGGELAVVQHYLDTASPGSVGPSPLGTLGIIY